jgi:hypothetical protein
MVKSPRGKMPNNPDRRSPSEHDTFSTPPELYRRRGMLEAHGYAPLPRTPITQAARERLHRLGCNDQRIEAIRELTASFRYDGLHFKLQRLAQYPIPTLEDAGYYNCNLPNVIDVKGTLMGQCSDIASQWIIQAHLSNLFADLPGQVILSIDQGQSPTHFCTPGLIHVWNHIEFVDRQAQQYLKVYFDASMQLICTPEESKYHLEGQHKKQHGIHSSLSTGLRCIPIDLKNPRIPGDTQGSTWVLGLDPEKTYAYGICVFVDPSQPGTDTPALYFGGLERYSQEGKTDYVFTHPLTGEILGSGHKNKLHQLDEHAYQYLELLKQLKFTEFGDSYLPNIPIDLAVSGSSIEWKTR